MTESKTLPQNRGVAKGQRRELAKAQCGGDQQPITITTTFTFTSTPTPTQHDDENVRKNCSAGLRPAFPISRFVKGRPGGRRYNQARYNFSHSMVYVAVVVL
ncbi:MAG TPA: hypothetical protein VGL91_18425, partial [Acidobacteriota bacterium]